jgi:AcrR family transcriptional regulator
VQYTSIPDFQNIVLDRETKLAQQAVRRALADRESAYVREVQRFLDAGQELMEQAGATRPVRVAEIVRRAGLSNQAFYRHFPSRDAFVAAVVERGAVRLVGYVTHQMEKATGPEDAVRRWITAVLSQAANPRVAGQTRAVMWNLERLPRDTHGELVRPPLADLLVPPLTDLGSPDPGRDAIAIADIARGRLDYHLWGPKATEDDVTHVIDFCLAAVRRRAAGN